METRPDVRRDSSGSAFGDGLMDVVIVSAYGRGNWLASELAGRGWKVTLVDVSDSLGPWEPEDCEGPFGLFEATDLLPSQKTQLADEGEMHVVPNGFTIWLKDGPLELKSELTQLHLARRNVSGTTESYLRRTGLPSKESERERKLVLKSPFSETWLAHFAHQIASTVYVENHEAAGRRHPSPLFAPFNIRQVTQAGWQKGLKACQANGARVRHHAVVKDLRMEGPSLDAIEVEDERSGVERGRAIVWMLSSGETERFSPAVHKQLYPGGSLEAQWFWARYQVEFTGEVFEEALPMFAAVIGDVYLPWTHANLLLVRRRSEAKCVDAWVRIPMWARFDSGYLIAMRDEIEKTLVERMPRSAPKTVMMPAESRHSFKKLGPPRFPVYEPEMRARFLTQKAPNLFFCGPEQWEFLDWLGQYRRQNDLLTKLEKLKAQWVAAANREAQRNASP